MAKVEQCDYVVGEGSILITAGSYKKGDDTRYKFGIKLDMPTFTDDLKDKIFKVGLHRVMSVKAASIFNKDNEYGTEEDAKEFQTMFSTVEGWEKAFEKVRKEGAGSKVDSVETLAIKRLSQVVKSKYDAGTLGNAKVAFPNADNPPLTEKGKPNWIAWAKQGKEAKHPWYDRAYKDVSNEKGFD